MQRDKIYPHIASHDAALGINAAWLHCLTDANFKFSQWATTKAVRLNVVSLCLFKLMQVAAWHAPWPILFQVPDLS